MLKKILLAIALMIQFMGANAQNLKIGLVDVSAIIQVMPETAEAQNKLADASKKYEAEYQRLGDEMKRLLDDYQSMKQDELQAIKDRKTRELNDFQQKMQTFEQNAQQDLSKMQQELMGPIVVKIRSAIESVGKENGYSIIQDLNPQTTFYYAAPIEDVTAAVKAKLGIK